MVGKPLVDLLWNFDLPKKSLLDEQLPELGNSVDGIVVPLRVNEHILVEEIQQEALPYRAKAEKCLDLVGFDVQNSGGS